MTEVNEPQNELVIYSGEEITTPLNIAFDGETLWLTQDQIAGLFGTTRPNVVQHIQNIYNSGELDSYETSKKILQVVENGRKYPVTHYNLDVVISVGYRVSSKAATRFRQWATGVIKERIAGTNREFDALSREEQRLIIFDRVAVENNELLTSAQQMKVTELAAFFDAGYRGMYKMTTPDIKARKNIGTDRVLDRAGITELAANEFRITQTNAKIQRQLAEGKLVGPVAAVGTHHDVGKEVRQAIERIGGEMPEDWTSEPEHISNVRQRITERKKETKNIEENSHSPDSQK